MRTRLMALVPLALVAGGAIVSAHHSFAAFDRTKQVTVTGVVREVQWNNPHTWIQVTVTDAKGKPTEWGFECGSPNMMSRTGWTSRTLKAGDKVTVVGNPLKDGRPNAALVRVTLPDGAAVRHFCVNLTDARRLGAWTGGDFQFLPNPVVPAAVTPGLRSATGPNRAIG